MKNVFINNHVKRNFHFNITLDGKNCILLVVIILIIIFILNNSIGN